MISGVNVDWTSCTCGYSLQSQPIHLYLSASENYSVTIKNLKSLNRTTDLDCTWNEPHDFINKPHEIWTKWFQSKVCCYSYSNFLYNLLYVPAHCQILMHLVEHQREPDPIFYFCVVVLLSILRCRAYPRPRAPNLDLNRYPAQILEHVTGLGGL